MATERSPVPLRLNPVDRHGKEINPAVLAAAEEVIPSALEYGLKMLRDPALVANVLEEVAAAVSRQVSSKDPPGEPLPIQNLAGYVFRGFVRRVNRLKSKQPPLVSSDGDGQPQTVRWADPTRALETKILVGECLAQLDFVTRDMFWRRAQGYSWRDIGKIHGLSGHAAEVRFRSALGRAQVRLRRGRRSLPSATRADQTEELKPAMQNDGEK
jgi:hypothetical protein